MTYALRSMISLFEKGITTGQFLVYWVLAKKKNNGTASAVRKDIFRNIFFLSKFRGHFR
jgi:hypothetical protein